MVHIMLDLETLGVNPDAPIIAIGAVVFGDLAPNYYGKKDFYLTVDFDSACGHGAKIDPKTVAWWFSQSDEARKEVCRGGAQLDEALRQFEDWVRGLRADHDGVCIWGNGAAFDNVLLRRAYVRAGINAPWWYREDRCFRTLSSLDPMAGQNHPASGVKHHALHDAKWQAEVATKILTTASWR